jgi:hypothetical protein
MQGLAHRMRSLSLGLVVVEEEEREGRQMKGEGVVVGEEVRRMRALVVGVGRLTEVREAAVERWIVAAGVEEGHSIEAKGEEVEVRFLVLVVGEQVEKKLEVMEEHSKMAPKEFWAAMVEGVYLMEELHGRDRGMAVAVYLMHEGEGVERVLVQEFWGVH